MIGIEASACEVEVDRAERGFEKAAIVDIPLPARRRPPFPRPHSVGGQESVKRAVTVAAAGGHNILTSGASASSTCN
ncbi:MAG: ATP-binding protein [Phycisphaerae bacterium]|nr:ATP-binding protein [Phycisphaerae bacterium]